MDSHRECHSFSRVFSSFSAAVWRGLQRRFRAAAAPRTYGTRDGACPAPSSGRGPRHHGPRRRRLPAFLPPTGLVLLPGTGRLVPTRTRRDRRAACPPETRNPLSCYIESLFRVFAGRPNIHSAAIEFV